MFKVFILCVLIFEIATAAVCPGSAITEAMQAQILSIHNNYRSTLAKGLSIIKGGALAAGAKNMNQLSYDCALEQTAQTHANKCLGKVHSTPAELNNAGENLFQNGPISVFTPQATITNGLNDWWRELANIGGITPTNVLFTTTTPYEQMGHWSQMAWAKTTAVGCAVKACTATNMQQLVCHYSTAGNVLGENIYEIGTACTADTDCTAVTGSKCNTANGLCYTGTTTSTTTTTTTTTKPTALGWTEWVATTCSANCGKCGRQVRGRICRAGAGLCPGAGTETTATVCGASTFCVFGLNLPSCCAPATRAIVNGVLTCA